MKQVEYLGRIYDIKEDAVEIGMNSCYQIFTKNNKCEYTFIESRDDLIGKINGLPQTITVVSEEPKPHPHADLMLKYAMIAQYDDKPWENFEFKNQYSDGWMRVVSPCWDVKNEYRLKPQEPKIQAGQVWADKTGIIVSVSGYDSGSVYIKASIGGLVIPWSFSKKHFLNNFKLQENK